MIRSFLSQVLDHLFRINPPPEASLVLREAAQRVDDLGGFADRQECGEEFKLPHRFVIITEWMIVRPAKQIVRLLKTRRSFMVNFKTFAKFYKFVAMLLRAVLNLVLPEEERTGIVTSAFPSQADFGRPRSGQPKKFRQCDLDGNTDIAYSMR